jgi:anthranilate phosphoribosyltransferase
MRQELGVRNVFHPVARLLNPARATSQVIGLSHPPYFEKTAEALRMLSCPRALVIRGVEGDPELSIGNVTRLLELKDDRITPFAFQPKDAGLAMATFREMAGFPAEQEEREADLIKRLLANEIEGGQRDWVLLNAAMLLYAAGKGTSIPGNLEAARRALESGQAKAKLDELVAVAGSDAGTSQKVGLFT